MPDLLRSWASNYTKSLFSWSRSSCRRIWTDSAVRFSVHLCSCLPGLCLTEVRTHRGHIWTHPLRSGRTLHKGRPMVSSLGSSEKSRSLWVRWYRPLYLSKGPSCGWSGCTCNLNLGRVAFGNQLVLIMICNEIRQLGFRAINHGLGVRNSLPKILVLC